MTKEEKINHILYILQDDSKIMQLLRYIINQGLINFPEEKLDEIITMLETNG